MSSSTISFYTYNTQTLTIASSTISFTIMDTSNQTIPKKIIPVSVSLVTGKTTIWTVTYNVQDMIAYAVGLNLVYDMFLGIQLSPNLPTAYVTQNQSNFDYLRSLFCFQSDTNCPVITNYNNTKNPVCSRLISANPAFNNNAPGNNINCNQFLQGILGQSIGTSPSTSSSVIQSNFSSYCTNNPSSLDCQCYLRNNDTNYKAVTTMLASSSNQASVTSFGNDVCWYTPCQFQNNILVPVNLISASTTVNCPNVCAQIISAINVQNVNITGNTFSQNCGGGVGAIAQSPTTAPTSSPPNSNTNTIINPKSTSSPLRDLDTRSLHPSDTNTNTNTNTTTSTNTWTYWVRGIVGLLLLLGLVLVVVRMFPSS